MSLIDATESVPLTGEIQDELEPLVKGGTVKEDDPEVNLKHLEVVLEQVPQATREQAIAALKKTKGDIVNAIMELIMI